jgi:hypothetical protein
VVSLLGNTHTSVIALTWMGSLHSDAHSLKDAGHGGVYIVKAQVLDEVPAQIAYSIIDSGHMWCHCWAIHTHR